MAQNKSDGNGNFQVTLEDMQMGGPASPSVVSVFDARLMEVARALQDGNTEASGEIVLRLKVKRTAEGSSELTLIPAVTHTLPKSKKQGFVVRLGQDGLTQQKQMDLSEMTNVARISGPKGK